MIAKRVEAVFKEGESLERLWQVHDAAKERYYGLQEMIDRGEVRLKDLQIPIMSFLDLKTEIARQILGNCHYCVRRCLKNRLEGELGTCGCGSTFLLSTAFHHMGEEPELVPSGTIFSIGCNLICRHCQNWTISQRMDAGEPLNPEALAREVESLHKAGCRNCNMVGGSPTPWLHSWLEAFKHVGVNVATVWNSNSYYSEETAELLKGFIDVYLLDYKYGNNKCATRISSAPGYLDACQRNHIHAVKNGELIIRVLLLPEHIDCCTKPTLKWIAENLGTWVRVNIMDQYTPHWRAYEVPELRRRLKSEEYIEAVMYAKELGLDNLA